jgi:SAM-dependent methyltransferase
MIFQTITFLVVFLLFALWYCNRTRFRRWIALLYEKGWQGTFHYDKCFKVLNKLYEGINTTKISLEEREDKKIQDGTYTYGEVMPYSLAKILELAQPKPGEVFYDLGSGGGKAIFVAALLYDFAKVCGIEKLSGLYQLSVQLLDRLNNLPEYKEYFPNKKLNIQFIQDDFRNQDISDADIVFISATCFMGELWDAIVAKLGNLKPGTRIILGSKRLQAGAYQLLHSDLHLMSWGMNSVNIYRKI